MEDEMEEVKRSDTGSGSSSTATTPTEQYEELETQLEEDLAAAMAEGIGTAPNPMTEDERKARDALDNQLIVSFPKIQK